MVSATLALSTGHPRPTRRGGAVPAGVALLLSLAGCLSPDEPGALVPPTVDQDPTLPHLAVQVAGRERLVHLRTFGDPGRPVLLLLHGSLADHRAWLPYETLADRYFVVMWDQRGNGLSERIAAGEYTWDAVVEEIAAIKEAFSPAGPVTLVGHSFGAMFSALYASRRADDVAQMALLEPAGLNGDIFTATFEEISNINLFDPGMSQTFWQSEVLSPADHEAMDYKALQLLLNGHQMNYHCDPDHPVPLPVWRPGAYVEYVRGLRMAKPGSSTEFAYDFAAGLDRFPRAVLLVGSSCSALGYEYQVLHHAPLFADAQVVRIESAGHRMFVEQRDATLAALRDYLDEYRAP